MNLQQKGGAIANDPRFSRGFRVQAYTKGWPLNPLGRTLQPWQVGETLGPGAAPVSGGGGLGFARSTPSGIALGAAGFLVGLSVAAGTALDPVQLSAGGEVGTVVAASQMPGDLEVNDQCKRLLLIGVHPSVNPRRVRRGRAQKDPAPVITTSQLPRRSFMALACSAARCRQSISASRSVSPTSTPAWVSKSGGGLAPVVGLMIEKVQ